MTDYHPHTEQQWRGGGERTSVKWLVLSILLALFIAFPLTTWIFVSQVFVIHFFMTADGFFLPFEVENGNPFGVVGYVYKAPTNFMIGTSVLSAILVCIAALGFWELRVRDQNHKGAKHQWRWTIANLSVTLANLAMVVACTIFTFVAGWSVNDEDIKSGKNVTATREAWVCAYERWNGRRWDGVVCRISRAGRWSLIPLVIFSCALVGVAMWHIAKRGGLRWLRKKGNGDELPKFGN